MAQAETLIVEPGSFEPHDHWYPKALNATIHPMISFFFNLEKPRIVQRYCHLHPTVNAQRLTELLDYQPKFFRWSGADLINVTTAGGKKQMVVIENNSCPSGQKSMPLLDDHMEQGGYRHLMDKTFRPVVNARKSIEGRLAVIYDKNPMETLGYARVMADVFDEPVLYIYFPHGCKEPPVRIDEGVLHAREPGSDQWVPLRAVFRYLTQKPWNRLPLHSKTKILNPIVSCLAGGRNKMVASKAYDLFNSELASAGMKINTPETIWDVSKGSIPLWIRKMGGQGVVKVPYSNAGQGVFTIVNEQELAQFMEKEFDYNTFIVQSLIGNYQWSSTTTSGKFYHVGTIPSIREQTYVFDLRMMIHATPDGLRPLSVYARRAELPLLDTLDPGTGSWDILGTNLSYKMPDGSWATDANRLMLTDRRDFNKLGLGLDDLIEAFIQSVLSTVAIDKMAETLHTTKGRFRMKLFNSLNDDQALIDEILVSE
ncbi:MAG: hypothetical protein R3301_05115 [Saprospiraceae bacterium]|nr:hypothetical protein [Saprospiraceae bacterium]